MSAFRQLGGLTKSAGGKTDLLLKGLKSLYSHGAWKTLGQVAERGVSRPGALGTVARGTKGVADAMNGKLGLGLGLYGATSMFTPLTGVSLPGSDLAFNLGMPIIGGMDTAANLITASRANTPAMREKIRQDALAGARGAGADFISVANARPDVLQGAGQYASFLNSQGVKVPDFKSFAPSVEEKPSGWKLFREAASEPEKLIEHQVKREAANQIDKSAGLTHFAKNLFPRIGGVLHHVMTPLIVGGSVYGLSKSILSDKPYDEQAVRQIGYDAAQANIQKKLGEMNPLERLAVKFDPSLAVRKIEKALPGTIKGWEANTGTRFQPGLLSSTVDALTPGGQTRFYSMDAAGNQNFVN
jgi:hypothetical protein